MSTTSGDPHEVEAWDPSSPTALGDLRQVLAIAKKFAATLGFLPNRAFADRARYRGLIIGKMQQRVAGYVLYDLPRGGHVKLVHVCVDDVARGAGLAKAMIEHVIELNSTATGLYAACRRDYGMSQFWRSLGMFPKKERPGRALKGSVLVQWWRPLGPLDLFESAALESSLPIAVLDTNVVADLYGSGNDERGTRPESLGLVAEWLADAVTFAVSTQVDQEIEATPDPVERRSRWEGSAHLVRLRTARPDDTATEQALLERIGAARLQSDPSLSLDVLHLADAIHANATYFVTNDDSLIRATSPWLAENYGVQIVRPHQLIGKALAHSDEQQFQSRIIESIDLAWAPVESENAIGALELAFVDYDAREPQRSLRRRIREVLSNQPQVRLSVLSDPAGQPWALVALSSEGETLRVPLLRVQRGQRSSTLGLQVARWLRREAVERGLSAVRIVIDGASRDALKALERDGFEYADAGHLRAEVLTATRPAAQLLDHVRDNRVLSAREVAQFETKYWPLKVTGAQVPTYVVPIQPRFSEQLFGYSGEVLFHSRRFSLGLSREHVYYYSGAARRVPGGPNRILWYVTADETNEIRQIAALSRVKASHRLPAREAHDRFAHLGVLRRRDVQSVADSAGFVNVIHFEDTELLRRPLGRTELRRLLHRYDIQGPFLSAREVPPAFCDDVLTYSEVV